jgi:hypothetical protein
MRLGLARDESVTRAIHRDESDLVGAMKHVLFSDDLRAAILALRGQHAVQFMDLLQEVRTTGSFLCDGTKRFCSSLTSLARFNI